MSSLVGKILRHIDEDSYCVSLLIDDLGDSLLLAVRLNPTTGIELPVRHVVQLSNLTEDDEIYEDFLTMVNYLDEDTEESVEAHTIQ
jgi:hypothetical protein